MQVKVIIEYPAEADPKDYRALIGKTLSTIRPPLRKLIERGEVKTVVRRAIGD